MHLIDANILITAHNNYYPTNRVPEFWSWVLHHAEHNRIKMPVEMIEEVQGGTSDAEKDLLYEWLQQPGVADTLRLDEEVDLDALNEILSNGYANDLNEVEIEAIGRDPFIMAYAYKDPQVRCVVTNEVRRPSAQRANRKIPDICDRFNLQSCNAFKLIRKLDFSTSWA
ncbi:DUF4411 family protein [Brevundimonas diminuta]|uniref:DUF4411 family protein n=1 Tax=Brevundimonas diminuta TaxID=293 RepID=UPI003D011E0A